MAPASADAGLGNAGPGKTALERIGTAYRAAYLAHDPALAPFHEQVRFTENHVEMRSPASKPSSSRRPTICARPGPGLRRCAPAG